MEELLQLLAGIRSDVDFEHEIVFENVSCELNRIKFAQTLLSPPLIF